MHCDGTVSKSLCTTTRNELIVICQNVIAFLVSGEKSKHRWNNIHTMTEAKAGLQALLNMVSVSVHSLLCVFALDRVLVGCTISSCATMVFRESFWKISFPAVFAAQELMDHPYVSFHAPSLTSFFQPDSEGYNS